MEKCMMRVNLVSVWEIESQEIEQSKVRHDIELEKIAVLTEFYNKKILELMKKEKVQPIENGSDS